MKKSIAEAIEILFKQENGQRKYLDLCRTSLALPSAFWELAGKFNLIDIETVNENEVWPSIRLAYQFPSESEEEKATGLRFVTEINISKLAPVFYIQHEFEINNLSISMIEPTLNGFGNSPYTKRQYEFHKEISCLLVGENFEELSFKEFNEVICSLEMPDNITIFGDQVTVESALFIDLYGRCRRD